MLKKHGRKSMSIFLTLAMVVSLLSVMTLTANAADPDPFTVAVNTTLKIEVLPIYGNPVVDNMFYGHGYTQPKDGSKTADLYWDSGKNVLVPYENTGLEIGSDFQSTIYFYATESGTYTFTATFVDNVTISNYTITVNVTGGNTAPTFKDESEGTLSVGQNAAATDIASLLHVSDSDVGQTLAWSQADDGAPSHGMLSFSSAVASSGSTDITPGGTITYTPTDGFFGSDSFTVQVSDGIATATRIINVTVTQALSSDAGLTSILDHEITAGLEAGTRGAPKTAYIDVANGVAAVAAGDIVKHDAGATVTFYGTDSSFTTPETGSVNLASGGTTDIYIMVVAEDSTPLHYKVTIDRAAALVDITAASVSGIITPTAGEAPISSGSLTAGAETYTVTGLTWQNSDGTSATLTGGKFKAGWTYKAVIELNSAEGYKFPSAGILAADLTVNAGMAGDGTMDGGDVSGNKITFTVIFSGTAAQSVTSITVKTQPSDLSYTAGEALDLTGLEVTLTYNDGSTEDVAFADFASKSITASPANETTLSVAIHNGQAITLTCNSMTATTNNLTVSPASLGAATVTITAPAAGETPQTVTQVESVTGNSDYTVTGLTWNESLTAGGKFKAGQAYTATITLTSKNEKTFQAEAFTPAVAGSSSAGTTITTGTGTGNTISFTVTFPATAALAVESIAVTTQPAKMNYTEGTDGTLALNSMVVTEAYNDGTAGTVTFTDGTALGYTATPANGTILARATNNGNPVTVTHTASGETAQTNNLTVNLVPAAAPAIGTHPADATKNIGETATFTVTATASGGGTLTYQWQKSTDGSSWNDIAGAADASYITPILSFADNGVQYRCVITNSKNGTTATATSDAAILTVNFIPITSASVTMTAPAAGADPQTVAQVEAVTDNSDYTVTGLTWNEPLTAGGKFKAGQAYTVTITLTSKNEKTFQAETFTPAVSDSSSVGTTATTGTGTGNTVSFTVTFPATAAKTVTAIAVKTQPAKLTYMPGETLDLSGLEVTLIYNDGTTEDVALAGFTSKGITANPANGNTLLLSDNGNPVTLTCNSKTATTNNLTVSAAPAISPTSCNYDLNAPADITTTITWNSAVSVTDAVYSIRPDVTVYTLDTGVYNIDDDTLTIEDSFFSDLSLTTGAALDFIFTFNTGATANLTVNVADGFVAVTDISGVPDTATAGMPLTLIGTVVPNNATNQTVTWSVYNAGDTGASISGDILSTTAAGVAVVRATVTNGLTASSDYTQDFNITVNAAPVTTYTITFSSNGRTYATKTVNAGGSIGSAAWPANPTRSSYIFGGWFTGENGTGTAFTSATSVNTEMTVYAKWAYRGGGDEDNDRDGDNGGSSVKPPEKTIIVTETSSGLFSGSTGKISASANMDNAFSNSVEVKVTDTGEDKASFQLGAGDEVYPFDISLYIKGTNKKTQPASGYAVIISLPVPEKLLNKKEPLSVVHKSDSGVVTTLDSTLEQRNGVWYLVFEATEFSPYALVVRRAGSYDESAGVPYYLSANGDKVFIGLAAREKYIAPEGVTVSVMQNGKGFTDVSGHWASGCIGFVTEREIFAGTGGNTFSPDRGMTRAMFATVIGRLYERSYGEIKPSDERVFTDCDYGAYYGKYVAWAAENGIIGGYGNGRFGPDDQIIREQMAALLYRFADFLGVLPSGLDTVLDYPDAGSISDYAKSAVLYCQTNGIIRGRTGGMFAPQETATRAEVATIIKRFVEEVIR